LKKVFNESCSATSKIPWRVQSDLSYELRVERYSDLRGHCIRLYGYVATLLLDQTYRQFVDTRTKVATYVRNKI
jgi:hypothetical protein